MSPRGMALVRLPLSPEKEEDEEEADSIQGYASSCTSRTVNLHSLPAERGKNETKITIA